MTKTNIGLVGLGTMGSALTLNIAEKGYPIAVTTRLASRTDEFLEKARKELGDAADKITGCGDSAEELVKALSTPRTIIFMVPAGQIVDDLIEQYKPLLAPGDTLVDAGNANFHNTRRRGEEMAASGMHFIGMGVSGGEDGARHGPSIMVGGDPESYAHVREMVEAISAKFEGAPCAEHLGPDGAGHFVKTVHNGIEYADMQLIAEVYGLLRDGEGKSVSEIGALFEGWSNGPLNSYLVEITAKVLAAIDSKTGDPAVDVILDRAGQKGTGRWTVIEALQLGQSASTIEAAVGARSWSSDIEARKTGTELLGGDIKDGTTLSEPILESALLVSRILAYAQGFQILSAASDKYDWNVDMARVAEIWRAGCIIRSALLDDISAAFRADLAHGNLLFAPAFAVRLENGVKALRALVASAVLRGIPVPAFSAALAWFDTMRQARGTTNLVQAQRDFFGAHGFERLDAEGAHHGPWWD
ncbi:NADP-dependent phosphogluconate dehydrogenase [Pseudohalocynthiibacter aestuariivivens]|jgi:6-phosphogluconate dehydrogenase|uniref:6-phosphogluconate dehydrogenase, decarboxylating n=1 Tax=Pseudohalocynthiibacter aestuariivivens TaxID=1591409 RepID=A0ABV5JFT6_9RHOB|nr:MULTISPECIES: NADP-dependent phosphogluconate dehydrogenase [Pseudohalocynthiibacter]MBS9717138.1 NADP-dependent phosphogluconate dehydrogenase [Pseudohalocynthiibacter aestuariivivens]MCK0104545.1 NADP-dependent phosphogluconate dehydrogenase [Pseudohalocynthiibacter sp. F2068]